jgi:hypothetical protein
MASARRYAACYVNGMNIKIVAVSFLFMNSVLIVYGQSTSRPAFNPTPSQASTIQVEPKVKTYGFVHWETTGITSYVIVNGKEKPILFSPDSDPLAMRSFDALNPRILLPNTDGKKLFLMGQYFSEPKHTRSCPGCAGSEEYREFKLVDWYIIAPFKVVREDCGPCPYLRAENLRTKSSLELKDFADFDGRDNMDVRRFQRKKRLRKRGRI